MKPVARRLVLDGISLGDFVRGREPTAEHPHGTLFALGYTRRGAYLLELDLASGAEIARASVGGTHTITREGDTVYVAWAEGGAVNVQAFDLARPSSHRVQQLGALKNDEVLHWFHVVAGHPVVVGRSSVSNDGRATAAAAVFDAEGKRLARHDCRDVPLGGPGEAIVVAHGYVVIRSIGVDTESPACGFEADGAPRTVHAKHPGGSFNLEQKDKMLLWEPDIGAWELDDDLRPSTRPVILDEPPHADSLDACSGITAPQQAGERMWGLIVVRAENCCASDEPDGIFLCDPSETSAIRAR